MKGEGLIRVLVHEPDPLAAAGLRGVFESAAGIEVVTSTAGIGSVTQPAAPTRRQVAVVSVADRTRASMAEIERLARAGIAVLTLTLEEDDDLLLATLEAGASGNHVKSADPDELVHAVRSLADGHPALSRRQSRLLLDHWVRTRRNPGRIEARRAAELLSARERDVVRAVTRGMTNSQIAAELHCAPTTVKAHLATVFTRLGVTNRVALAILGLRAGLLDDD
ncbi:MULTISPECIES: LuxR C-terminal-related transcriptional regulator [unclassified Curtobacterium]|uniref:LuxR C-terminal-related transcriptional regulator n=1 Tax=unclassified Curtobacterium TaxID=257496 RepID=UPI00382E60FA